MHIVNELDKYYFSVRPKLSKVCVKQLLFGTSDLMLKAGALLIDSEPLGQDNNEEKGLLILISEYEKSMLCAVSGAYLLNKMLNYQNNIHAEVVIQEFG